MLVRLGRSWSFQFKDEKSIRPVHLILELEKDVDAMSGMTVNLATIDQWFKSSSLPNQSWTEEKFFLKAIYDEFNLHAKKAQATLNLVATEFNSKDRLTYNGTEYTWGYICYFAEKTSNLPQFRQAQVSSTSKLPPSQKKNLESALSSVTALSQVRKLKTQFPDLTKVTYFDISATYIQKEIILL